MKETELKNTSETSEREVQNLSGQDKARKHRKTAKAAISFIVMIVLLVALFFAAVNIGSLKVSFPELLKGLFVKYNEDVATIYDLRFPRIVISMLAGAAIAVSGVLFQAV
ncbi:MAG TPA: iron chelate uptake ABC transporter family permease subunit, partial [Blautia wexlerae]|nr:iron chelate uptake ABC transporter family permease subunit [Blautia wexlerae]